MSDEVSANGIDPGEAASRVDPVGELGKRVDLTNNMVYGVVIVVVVLLVTLVTQYFSATQATFEDLKDNVIEQNAKIDVLTSLLSQQPSPPLPHLTLPTATPR